MENQNLDNYFDSGVQQHSSSQTTQEVKAFFSGVYSYMFLALAVSGFVAWYVASSGLFFKWFVTPEGGMTMMFYVVLFAPVALVFFIQARFQHFSMGTLISLFLLYSALIGASFASIFFVFNTSDLATTFFVTAGAFGAMAVLGYTTSVDLTKMGSLLYMGFIGIFIASIVNVFLGNSMMSFIISILGVFVFTGLTAWEMQKLKALATNPAMDEESLQRMKIIGGLTLYILFINLFMSLLRLIGNRD